MSNPFIRYNPAMGREVGACSAADRLDEIKRSDDQAWLKLVISHPDMQTTVVKAAKARLRKMEQAA